MKSENDDIVVRLTSFGINIGLVVLFVLLVGAAISEAWALWDLLVLR